MIIDRQNEKYHKHDTKHFQLRSKLRRRNSKTHNDSNKTQFIKKYSLKSFNANDRSKKFLINFTFVLFKIDNFHQLKIQLFKEKI